MKEKLLNIARQSGNILCGIFASIFLPIIVSLWYRHASPNNRMAIDEDKFQAGDVACNVNKDCPPGYMCIGGKCILCLAN